MDSESAPPDPAAFGHALAHRAAPQVTVIRRALVQPGFLGRRSVAFGSYVGQSQISRWTIGTALGGTPSVRPPLDYWPWEDADDEPATAPRAQAGTATPTRPAPRRTPPQVRRALPRIEQLRRRPAGDPGDLLRAIRPEVVDLGAPAKPARKQNDMEAFRAMLERTGRLPAGEGEAAPAVAREWSDAPRRPAARPGTTPGAGAPGGPRTAAAPPGRDTGDERRSPAAAPDAAALPRAAAAVEAPHRTTIHRSLDPGSAGRPAPERAPLARSTRGPRPLPDHVGPEAVAPIEVPRPAPAPRHWDAGDTIRADDLAAALVQRQAGRPAAPATPALTPTTATASAAATAAGVEHAGRVAPGAATPGTPSEGAPSTPTVRPAATTAPAERILPDAPLRRWPTFEASPAASPAPSTRATPLGPSTLLGPSSPAPTEDHGRARQRPTATGERPAEPAASPEPDARSTADRPTLTPPLPATPSWGTRAAPPAVSTPAPPSTTGVRAGSTGLERSAAPAAPAPSTTDGHRTAPATTQGTAAAGRPPAAPAGEQAPTTAVVRRTALDTPATDSPVATAPQPFARPRDTPGAPALPADRVADLVRPPLAPMAADPGASTATATARPAPAPRPARPERPTPDRFLEVLQAGRPERARPLPAAFAPLARTVAGTTAVAVRHDTASRAALAAVGKRAATVGRTIHLAEAPAPGPRADAATAVLAHELTHVANPSPVPRFFDDDHDSAEERRARRVADLVVRAPGMVLRQPTLGTAPVAGGTAVAGASPATPLGAMGSRLAATPTSSTTPTSTATTAAAATATVRRSPSPGAMATPARSLDTAPQRAARPATPGAAAPASLPPPPPRLAPAAPAHLGASTMTPAPVASMSRSRAADSGTASGSGSSATSVVRRSTGSATGRPTQPGRPAATPTATASAVAASAAGASGGRTIRRATTDGGDLPASDGGPGSSGASDGTQLPPIIAGLSETGGVLDFVDWVVEQVEDRVVSELHRRGGRFREEF